MEMPPPDPSQLMQMWLEFATKMSAAGSAVAPESPPSDAAKQMRGIFLQALGQATEQYMRSPQYLASVKQSMDSSVAFRQQLNDFMAQLRHATGGLARPDIDCLLMAVRRCETRTLDKLDELANQLNNLEDRLNALESSNAEPAVAAK